MIACVLCTGFDFKLALYSFKDGHHFNFKSSQDFPGIFCRSGRQVSGGGEFGPPSAPFTPSASYFVSDVAFGQFPLQKDGH